MRHIYHTVGVCSKRIILEIQDGLITDLTIEGGCNGNLKGIRALVLHQSGKDIIPKLAGITCGVKASSCPDQLSKAVAEALALY